MTKLQILLTNFGDLTMGCGKCGCGSMKPKLKVKKAKKAAKKKK